MAAILVVGAGAFDLGLLTVALTLPARAPRVARRRMGRPASPPAAADRRRPRPRGRAAVDSRSPRSRSCVTLPLLYAVAAITGVATVLFELADHVFITDLVGRKRLLDANGKREAVDAVAEISGPALGGALVAWLDRAARDRRRRGAVRRLGAR